MLGANTYKALALAGVVAGGVVADARPARACGGCFSPPTEVTVVNEHRMVFSVSQTQTVLWDQIKYSGNPKEFAWVLPVKPGTTIQLSHDEFIAALDAYTQPVIVGPQQTQKGSSFSVGCGSSVASSYNGTLPPVTVVNDQVVGPYEAVTLHATSGDSLNAWLTSHQYAIPAAVQPIIDSYVKEQFDFIALRLLPNQGVDSMQPVRVVTLGADATLPLRMVAAGVGQDVGVLLYVIGEGRYGTQNFKDVTVDDSQLVWDSAQGKSNYSTLAEAVMANDGTGKPGVLTEFAGHAFSSDFATFQTLDQFYQSAIAQNTQCSQSPYYDASYPSYDANVPDTSVADADVDGAADDAGSADAAVPLDASTPDGGGTTDNTCNFDDITVATKGMVQSDVWVTRLRMHLPVSALGDDLHLAASDPQALVNPRHQTPTPDSGGCSEASGGSNTWLTIAMGGLAVALLARRRNRRA